MRQHQLLDAEGAWEAALWSRGLFHARCPALFLDTEAAVLDVNAAAVEAYGSSRAELIGRRFHELVPADRRDEACEIFKACLDQGGLDSVDIIRKTADGGRTPVLATLSVVPADDPAHVRVVVVEQERTDRICRQWDDQRLALDVTETGVWDWDIESGQVEWDAQTRKLLGVSTPGPLTRDIIMSHVHPKDAPRIEKAIEAALAGEAGGSYDVEYRVVLHDGTKRWVSAKGKVLFEKQGEVKRPIRFIGVVDDITARHRMEEALRRSEHRLRIQARRKDRFLAILAHEMRNALAALGNGARLLQDPSFSKKQHNRTWAMMSNQISRMSRLADDLSDLSKIRRGKLALRKKLVALTEIVENACQSAMPMMDGKAHDFSWSAPAQELLLEADPTRLEQILVNLLSNASKYTPVGGRIRLKVHKVRRTVRIDVSDNGLGLSDNQMQTVFDSFHQADEGVGGLGIGLTLARRLARMHGGEIMASSAGLGKGSTFTLELPLPKQLTEKKRPLRTRSSRLPLPSLGATHHVLLVEDNPDVAWSLATVLEKVGCKVRIASNGEQAIQAAARSCPDVVLLDIGLPDMKGWEVADRLADLEGFSKSRIVVLTGHQGEDTAAKARSGFLAFLAKPVSIQQLLATLEGLS
jgi:PAS domain S-box-containing protein